MSQPAYAYRTLSCVLHPTSDALVSFGWATAGLGMQAKNGKHSGLFVARNIHSLFDNDGRRKSAAKGDTRIIDEVNEAIRAINKEHQAKNLEIARENDQIRQQNKDVPRLNEEIRRLNQMARDSLPEGETFEPIPEIKKTEEIPLKKIYREFGARCNPARPKDILDRTLLFRVVQNHKDQDGEIVWPSIPAVVAQQAVLEVIEGFNGYREAMRLYRRAPERFTGRPQWPDYGEKHLPIPITFTGQSLLKKKKSGEGKEYRFVAADGKHVYLDHDKTRVLAPWVLEALEAFPLDKTIADMRAGNGLPDSATLNEVRLIPLPDYGVELQAIFKVPMALPAGCLAEQLYGQLKDSLKPSEINDALLKMLRDIPADKLPRIAAIDPGLNNFLAMAYSFRQRAMVLSNQSIERELERFDRRYDKRQSVLMTEELRELQAKSEAKQLSPGEWVKYKKEIKAIHTDEQLRRIKRDRANWKHNMLHKVSTEIIDYLVRYHVQVLVIGLNTFWKHGIHRGRKMNRRSYRTAHTRLIELLKYKGLAAGILVVTTEESYTSKTSFALDEELQVYDATKDLKDAFEVDETEEADAGKAQAPVSGEGPTQGETPPAAPVKKVVLQGRRGRDDKRNFFTSLKAPEGWDVIHADVNGAFNIMRKVFRHFRWHKGLTPKFLVFRFDHYANLSRLQLA